MEVVSSVTQIAMTVTDPSQIGGVRRAVKGLCEQLDFTDEQAGKVAIVVTEAATNLAIHAKQGELLLCPNMRPDGTSFIDIIALDRGPGISDLARCMDDGFSTAGTPGNGLGAIRRLSDKCELFSQFGAGTVLLSRIFSSATRTRVDGAKFDVGFICLPVKGESVSGDTVAFRSCGCGGAFMIADGLGHGVSAHEASMEAGKIFVDEKSSNPGEMLDSIHHGIRATRGAAVAVASIDCEARLVRYSGIGNIAGAIFQGDFSRSLISHNGIVGHQSPKVQEFTYEWPASGMLVMNSDGLVTNWRLNPYPGLAQKDPALVAAVLYRDFSRGRDDVAILVVKEAVNA
jgi:anti-sigma regulatory factor (Ser/Thr protein kinase)